MARFITRKVPMPVMQGGAQGRQPCRAVASLWRLGGLGEVEGAQRGDGACFPTSSQNPLTQLCAPHTRSSQ